MLDSFAEQIKTGPSQVNPGAIALAFDGQQRCAGGILVLRTGDLAFELSVRQLAKRDWRPPGPPGSPNFPTGAVKYLTPLSVAPAPSRCRPASAAKSHQPRWIGVTAGLRFTA